MLKREIISRQLDIIKHTIYVKRILSSKPPDDKDSTDDPKLKSQTWKQKKGMLSFYRPTLKEKRKKDQSLYSYRPHVLNPEDTTVLLFPGQGSQFVGMGKKIMEYPSAKKVYDEASYYLGYDVLDLCLNGPKEKLDSTDYCQHAVFVTSIAALEFFKESRPEALENIVAAAGFSLGEITALVSAGVLTFSDALQVIKTRSTSMKEASEARNSGMISLRIFYASKLKLAIKTALTYTRHRLGLTDTVLNISGYLSTEYQTIAGHEEALQFIIENAEEFNLRSLKRLPVSGAFHTSIMHQASKAVQNELQNIPFFEARHPVHTNIDGKIYKQPEVIKFNLCQQIIKPVQWEQTMQIIYKRKENSAFPKTFECGPGAQLGFLLHNTNKKAYKNYNKIEV